MLTFEQFVACLPSRNHSVSITGHDGMATDLAAVPGFVGPDINFVRPLEQAHTSLIIVRAPGALGKSTIARELTVRTKGILWDLSTVTVAQNSFSGTLLKNGGSGTIGALLEDIHAGRIAILIDALDETEVRSTGFDAFLDEIAAMAKQPRQLPTLLLFARTETAAWVEMYLDDQDVPLAIVQPCYFNRQQSNEFIANQLDPTTSNHRRHVVPFEQARDQLIQSLCHTISVEPEEAWSDQFARVFFGYAPVLESIADLLAQSDNYSELVREFHDTGFTAPDTGESKPWFALHALVNHLLAREQKKLVDNVRGQIEASASRIGWSSWDQLYLRDEQCQRALHAVQGVTTSYSNSCIPSELLPEYLEASHAFAQQHAFLSTTEDGGIRVSNIVFRAYLDAWALLHGPVQLKESVRRRLADAGHVVQPALGYFILSLAADDAAIDSADFAYLYASMRAAMTEDSKIEFYIDGDLGGSECTFSWPSGQTAMVSVNGTSIHLGSRVSDLTMIAPDTKCVIGISQQNLIVGSRVRIECRELCINATDMRVSTGGDGVSLVCDYVVPQLGDVKLNIDSGDGFEVVGKGPYPFPFDRHASSRVSEARESVSHDLFLSFRRILLHFGGTHSGKPTRGYTWMERKIAPDGIKRRVLDYMVEKGVITKDNRLYIADTERMAEIGVIHEDLVQGVLAPSVEEFLSGYSD